jgi:hypothetical protein
MNLISLILSLPTENATVRMRAWRALKAAGSSVLRDGVYLLPDRADLRAVLESIASDVTAAGGHADVLTICDADPARMLPLFSRDEDYAALLAEIRAAQGGLNPSTVQEVLKLTRKLRKRFAVLSEIDFYAGEAQVQADTALQSLEQAVATVLSPHEPQARDLAIHRLQIADFQGRIWATRQRPWVDRMASGWLIRRFIDPAARMLWLATPLDCPPDALGYDFDGATFSHVGSLVTFEVLLASFAVQDTALSRIAALVHYLDVGGVQPLEAVGIETVLAGLRAAVLDDDALLAASSQIFDGLYTSFQLGNTTP